MVAHVLRLRLDALVGALRGPRSHVVRRVVAAVLLLLVLGASGWAILSLDDASDEAASVVTVLAGSAIVLGFALAPVLAGATDPLDPRRFAVFALPPRGLAWTLVLAGLISVPTLALLGLGVCVVLLWAAHGVDVATSVLALLAGLVTCILVARISMALSAVFLQGRRSRELSGVFVLVLLVVLVPVGVFLGSLQWGDRIPPQLQSAADVLAVTPLGAAAAIPARIALGDGLLGSIAMAFATATALGILWTWLVPLLLRTTDRPVAVRERGGLGWFAVAPGTPGGAVAARSIQYWMRDRRYLVNVLAIPVAGVLTLGPLLFAGVPLEYAILVPVPLMALFFGWSVHNDLAYDSTAVWLHFASGVRGISDRVGRLVPITLFAVPVLAIGIPITVSLHGPWSLLPAVVGVCAALFLAGLGLSSIASVVAPYAVSAPGESPFRQPQRTGSAPALAQTLVLLGAILAAAPAMWWSWLALQGDRDAADAALWGGIGAGVLVLAAGVAIGSAVFERRESALMEFAETT